MTVKDSIKIMREHTELTQNEMAAKLGIATSTLYNTLNNNNGMSISVMKLVDYANSMGYQVILKKDSEELVIDGESKLASNEESKFETILSHASNLTKDGKPLPKDTINLREEREKKADKLLEDYFVHHKEVDISAELQKIWQDDRHMYNYYMFRYRDIKGKTSKGKLAII